MMTLLMIFTIACLIAAAGFTVRAVRFHRAGEEVSRLGGSGVAIPLVGALILPMSRSLGWALLIMPLFVLGNYPSRSFNPWGHRDPP